MRKYFSAISDDRFLSVFYDGFKDFFSLDNDLISDEVQEILKYKKNRDEFLKELDDLRYNDKEENEIILESGNIIVRSI